MWIPLLMVLSLTVLGIIRGAGMVGFGADPVGDGWDGETYVDGSFEGNQTLDGESSRLSGGEGSQSINILLGTGVIIALTVSVGLVVVSGITVLGSGLNSVSVMAIFKTAFAMSLWGVCSWGAVGLLGEIPFFGLTLYFLLTFFFCIGLAGEVV